MHAFTVQQVQAEQERQERTLLTDKQQEWLNIQRMMANTNPKKKFAKPRAAWRLRAFHIAMSKGFDVFMIAVILANIVVMFMTHDGQSVGVGMWGEVWKVWGGAGGVNIAMMFMTHQGQSVGAGVEVWGSVESVG